MTRVSKRALDGVEHTKLYQQFHNAINQLTGSQTAHFFEEFFGPEEQVMFAKRLAAILLLAHGQSLYSVADKLHLSTSTTKQYSDKLNRGSYDGMLRALKRNKINYSELLDAIDSILHLGGIMPHYGQTHKSEAYKKRQHERNLSFKRKVSE